MNFAQQGGRVCPIEISDTRSQIKHKLAAGNLTQKGKTVTEVRNDRLNQRSPQLFSHPFLGFIQGGRRNVDRKILDSNLPPGNSLQKCSRFRRCTSAKLYDRDRTARG